MTYNVLSVNYEDYIEYRLITLIAVVSGHCRKDTYPIVTLHPVFSVPDNNFLNAPFEKGVNKKGDGIISTGEAAVITCLDVIRLGISKS